MRRNWSSPEAEAAGGRHPPLLPSAGWTEIDAGGAAGELARRWRWGIGAGDATAEGEQETGGLLPFCTARA